MFLKKIYKHIFLFLVIFLCCFKINSNEIIYKEKIINFFENLDEFSSAFLQIQENEISEGFLFIKNKRIRIEYTQPTNIIFVIKKKKAMYYNVDLEEVEYFNTKNTAGQYLFEIFNNRNFLKNAEVIHGEGFFYLTKKILVDGEENIIDVFFEEKPFNLKKLHINNSLGLTSFTITNSDFNPTLKDKMFSLVNPLLG